MNKVLVETAYTELNAEQHDAVTKFLGDNGINYRYSVDDLTWVIVLNATGSDLTALETNVFGAAVTA